MFVVHMLLQQDCWMFCCTLHAIQVGQELKAMRPGRHAMCNGSGQSLLQAVHETLRQSHKNAADKGCMELQMLAAAGHA